MAPKRLLRLVGYAAHSRYLSTVDDRGFTQWIPRLVHEPYRYSPSALVYDDPRRGKVFIAETKHRTYDVFQVPADQEIYPTDDQASAVRLAADRARARELAGEATPD